MITRAGHGAVIGLEPSASPTAIAGAVRRLLDDLSYRRGAEALDAR